MFNEAISLIPLAWTSLNSWLTPTFLFLLLNLMIGIIFITSAFASSKPQLQLQYQYQQQQHEQSISRAPTILERLKSANFYSYYSQYTHVDQPTLPQNVALQQQFQNLPSEPDYFPEPASELKPGKFTESQTLPIEEEILLQDDDAPTLEEIYNKIKSTSSIHHYDRQNSDTKPVGGEIPVRLPAKIKKSASHKSAFNHFQTVPKPENVANTMTGGGTEVDERADDFINRFKKQLQLQRIESILRYKEMITKGRGK